MMMAPLRRNSYARQKIHGCHKSKVRAPRSLPCLGACPHMSPRSMSSTWPLGVCHERSNHATSHIPCGHVSMSPTWPLGACHGPSGHGKPTTPRPRGVSSQCHVSSEYVTHMTPQGMSLRSPSSRVSLEYVSCISPQTLSSACLVLTV